MATLLRTAGSAKKIITGFNPSGVAQAFASSAVNVSAKREAHTGTDFTYGKAHTDVTFGSSFDEYRLDETKDVTKYGRDTEPERLGKFNSLFYGVGGMVSLYVAKEFVQMSVLYTGMPAEQRALASVEIDLTTVPEGQTKTFEWRGKPIFVKHRTAKEVERERKVNVSDLRDPQKDEERVQKDEWSIVIGVCTHLGCIPIAGAGDFGGYFCPCHGSHYDASGRIRKGPAPKNLEVPSYQFKGDSVVIGA